MGFDVSNLYVGRSARRGYAQSAQDANRNRIDQIRQDMKSVTAHGFLENERIENERIEAERAAAVKAAEQELNHNLSELHRTERENAFNPAFQGIDGQVHHYEDPRLVFDENAPTVFYSKDELNAYNKSEVKSFLRENPDYFPDMEGKNQDTIFRYLTAHGKNVIVSAKMLKNVFERLTHLGLLIPRPAPVAAPAPARVAPATPVRPAVWDVNEYPYFQNPGGKSSDMISGFDPSGSGQRVTLSRLAVEKMDADSFKYFGRPTVQAKPEWAKVEDREMMASQFERIGR